MYSISKLSQNSKSFASTNDLSNAITSSGTGGTDALRAG